YHSSGAPFSRPQPEFHRSERVGEGYRVANENSFFGPKIPFVRVSQCTGERRNLSGSWLVGRHQAVAETGNRSEKWRGNRLFNSEGRRADVFRKSCDSEGREPCLRSAYVHRLSFASGRGSKEHQSGCLC